MRLGTLFLPSILLATFTSLAACQDDEPANIGAAELKKVFPRKASPTCRPGNFLCVYFAGESCIDPNGGDTCCIDGSGVCSNGYECGTGVAASRCCQSGSTPEQCAAAALVGTATTLAPLPTKTKTKAPKHTTTKKHK